MSVQVVSPQFGPSITSGNGNETNEHYVSVPLRFILGLPQPLDSSLGTSKRLPVLEESSNSGSCSTGTSAINDDTRSNTKPSLLGDELLACSTPPPTAPHLAFVHLLEEIKSDISHFKVSTSESLGHITSTLDTLVQRFTFDEALTERLRSLEQYNRPGYVSPEDNGGSSTYTGTCSQHSIVSRHGTPSRELISDPPELPPRHEPNLQSGLQDTLRLADHSEESKRNQYLALLPLDDIHMSQGSSMGSADELVDLKTEDTGRSSIMECYAAPRAGITDATGTCAGSKGPLTGDLLQFGCAFLAEDAAIYQSTSCYPEHTGLPIIPTDTPSLLVDSEDLLGVGSRESHGEVRPEDNDLLSFDDYECLDSQTQRAQEPDCATPKLAAENQNSSLTRAIRTYDSFQNSSTELTLVTTKQKLEAMMGFPKPVAQKTDISAIRIGAYDPDENKYSRAPPRAPRAYLSDHGNHAPFNLLHNSQRMLESPWKPFDPTFLAYGITYKPEDPEQNYARCVVIEELPTHVKMKDVLSIVRGGAIASATIVDTTSITGHISALVTFIHPESAHKYAQFALKYALKVCGQFIRVSLINTPTYPMSTGLHVAVIRDKQTRHIRIRHFPQNLSEEQVRHFFHQVPQEMEQTFQDEFGALHLLFTSVNASSSFWGLLQASSIQLKAKFKLDPCAGPLWMLLDQSSKYGETDWISNTSKGGESSDPQPTPGSPNQPPANLGSENLGCEVCPHDGTVR